MKSLFITWLAFAHSATTTSAYEPVKKLYPRQTSSASPAVHTVTVGPSGEYRYYPNVTYANPGDIVTFEFFPTNHSVIRGEYTGWPGCGGNGCNPCVPYELYHPDEMGFFSKNQEVASFTDASKTIWNLTVNDTNPIWFYCDALNSCHPNGMVGVINPNSSVHIDTQYDAAVHAAYELAPGQDWPAEGSDTSSGSGGSSKKSSSSLSGGAIAGIVVGSLAGLAILAALLYYMGRSHAYAGMFKHGVTPSQPGTSQAPFSEVGETSPVRSGPAPYPFPPIGSEKSGRQTTFSDATSHNMAERQKQQTGSSPLLEGGTFVGYNRQTGAPEFAVEASNEGEVKNATEIRDPQEMDAGQERTVGRWGSLSRKNR